MKKNLSVFALACSALAVGWGVFLVEDGLFNSGSTDLKEITIGVTFIIPGLLYSLKAIFTGGIVIRLAARPACITLVLLFAAYGASVYLRWQNHVYASSKPLATANMVGHVKNSNEWVMFDPALLQRPAHWYETGVEMTYLDKNNQQASTIRLPVKYLSLKSIKTL